MAAAAAAAGSKYRGASPYRFASMGFASTSSPHHPHSLNSSRMLPRPSSQNRGRGLAQVVPRISETYNSENVQPDESCDFSDAGKENICVTVRFRPLSDRESLRGDDAVWYPDENTVRSEYNISAVYAYDKVFGPTTSTRSVYDTAARHVVRGSMEGINGTVFAYGVTSSGKTHTMHGDQNFPGIIPLAVKDVFSIIQETPGREFLLRVTYLEIYNEVINDLLDPAGQNLRIREDAQGTYVEGVKEEVVLSPAHALSLIAAGEEHRHVGSNNFNLFSSRSHTIFTLTIESSVRGRGSDDEVTLSQLNLIDLAGSESSKTETTGLRRKEGSYINKSLLTLGTVISKLSEGRASHIPYRDSKLTRLLQSSLSGHGRISLICTITPASSNMEETHNTLKFAQRAKRIAIYAAPNRIIDERSLIKKYQKEIANLRKELDVLKGGMVGRQYPVTNHDDLITLRQQLEAGQMKMQSRLEEEEQAKAALMGRIHKLTKLILVSTKNNLSSTPGHNRRYSMAESEERYDDQSDLESTTSVPLGDGSPMDSERPDNVADQIDLTREQVKMLAGEIALRSSSLKRLSEQATHKPDDPQIQVQIKLLKDDIEDKINQMQQLEQRVMELGDSSNYQEMSQMLTKLTSQLNEKSFELEIRTADNRILEEQLKFKTAEIKEHEERNQRLQQQLQEALQKSSQIPKAVLAPHNDNDQIASSWLQSNDLENRRAAKKQELEQQQQRDALLQAEVDILSQEKTRLFQEKNDLMVLNTKLEGDAIYAKELAASAASEIKCLTEQLKILLSQNAKLISDAESMASEVNHLKSELRTEREKRLSSDKTEMELRKKVEESKQREADLEKDLSDMWILVAKMRTGEPLSYNLNLPNVPPPPIQVTTSTLNIRRIKDQHKELEKLRAAEKDDVSGMKALVSQLKDENVDGLDAKDLEDLQALHVEALSKLCNAKSRIQERKKETEVGLSLQLYDDDDRRAHICKICFESQTAAVLLPCRHFCLCQQCAVACTECPLCRCSIADRIFTFAS